MHLESMAAGRVRNVIASITIRVKANTSVIVTKSIDTARSRIRIEFSD